MTDIRSRLKTGPLLFDGGMGTYFSQRNSCPGSGCELANLSQPELIADIHREYLDSGAQAIKTNTFAVNRITFQGDEELAQRTLTAGWTLSTQAAAAKEAYVFADIGPISAEFPEEEYRWVVDRFLELGANHFLFETNASAEALGETAAYIRSRAPEAYIIVTFAVQPDGFSREGFFASELLKSMQDQPVDAVGFNCVCGARHMLELVQGLDHSAHTLALMPNAGYPVVVNNRTFYEGDPAYFASQLSQMAGEGAAILGGCCGTTPVHIAQARQALAEYTPVTPTRIVKTEPQTPAQPDSLFWQKLSQGERVVAVELDPPADTDLTKFMAGARQLKRAGVDIMTIADCPIARARMDSSILACKVQRELQLEALPHMTCRDRNLNATKALLLGLYAEGVRNVLLVTGDPVPTAERDEVKSVYQFNSRKLAAFVSALGEQQLPQPFHLFGALNLNALNFDVQLKLAKEKLERGMKGFLTQPVLTQQALDNLKRARTELPGAYLLGGIIPVVSARNARFMDSEISGINVDPRITALYEGKDRAQGEELAIRISAQIAQEIAPWVDGFYLMTPFQRTALICHILDAIHHRGLL
jgi:homocysteine S-methyltransferase